MMLTIFLILIFYVVIGSVLPFLKQPKISETERNSFNLSDYYAESDNTTERAYIILNNGEALKERLRMIHHAEERIIISTYKFTADLTGKAILAALLVAANRGIKIQIIIDGISMMSILTQYQYFYALLQSNNVDIRIYNPISLIRPWSIMGRLHDKYMIIDNSLFTLGGRNIESRFMGYKTETPTFDWDVLIYNPKVNIGQGLHQLSTYFNSIWGLPTTKKLPSWQWLINKKAVNTAQEILINEYKNILRDYPTWFKTTDYLAKTTAVRNLQLITNPIKPRTKSPLAFYKISQLMSVAQHEVRFHTPYLIANNFMYDILTQIVNSTPKITVMTNSIENNINLFGAMDYLHNKSRILKTGIDILEYDTGNSYHGKVFVIDNNLSALGSFNWDLRSTYINTELMLVINGEEFNQQMRQTMAYYENKALIVLDEKKYEDSAPSQPQQLNPKKRFFMRTIWFFARIIKFLM